MEKIIRRLPLLMMRTRSLHGPFFGRHAGNRASHPLAHSVGNAYTAGGPFNDITLRPVGGWTGNEDCL